MMRSNTGEGRSSILLWKKDNDGVCNLRTVVVRYTYGNKWILVLLHLHRIAHSLSVYLFIRLGFRYRAAEPVGGHGEGFGVDYQYIMGNIVYIKFRLRERFGLLGVAHGETHPAHGTT